MLYHTANQAIAASRRSGEAVSVVVSRENWAALVDAASDRWVDGGKHFFSCAERGDEWIVVIAKRPTEDAP